MLSNNLVSVETQSELSLVTGQRETRIFVKMYVDAVHSGLIADMGAERWQTLCVIAAFMDAEGSCYPTQELIAHRLGVKRSAANRRVKALAEYRWNGRPLIEVKRSRHDNGTWENARYRILSVSHLSMFDN
jgi:DNA-binding MarR family transcriptional regulator